MSTPNPTPRPVKSVELVPDMFYLLKVKFLREGSYSHVFETPDFCKIDLHMDWFLGNLYFVGADYAYSPDRSAAQVYDLNKGCLVDSKLLPHFVVGNRVRVLDGRYKGWTGTVVRVLKSRNIVVAFNADGSFTWQAAWHEVELLKGEQ